MTGTGITFDRRDLKFFGTVSASISHEMKNVLAIINEMMGLLDDLSRMAASGRPLNLERLQSIAGRMKIQIERGDGIIRGLNRFAHSTDHELETLDLADVVDFVACLARRPAAMKEVSVDIEHPGQPVRVTTNAFALEHLIWSGLTASLARSASGSKLSIKVNGAGDGARISFQPESIAPSDGPAGQIKEDGRLAALADRVGAGLIENTAAAELIVHLPAGDPTLTTQPEGDLT